MRLRFALYTTALLLTVLLAGQTALAVDTPTLDDVISPIDATKIVITGTTEPDYKVVATGGLYEISPVYADENGEFEITVALIQESSNTISIKIEDSDGNASDVIQVVVVESAEEAAAAESSGGGDHTAPQAPTIDDVPETIDARTYTFTGTGEASTTVTVTGQDETTTVDSDGTFSITLDLEQNEDNTFKFVLKDASGNISPSTSITLTEVSESTTEVDEETGEVGVSTTDENGEVVVVLLSDIYGHWAQDYITELVALGIVEGYDDGTFLPNTSINRAEFLKITLGALDIEILTAENQIFDDVPVDEWYADYVYTAYMNGIVEGYDDGTFGPGNSINRAEAVKILLTAADVEIETTESIFDDVINGAWYADYVMTAYTMGLVSGYDDGTFGPENDMTRAQVCKVIVELLDQM